MEAKSRATCFRTIGILNHGGTCCAAAVWWTIYWSNLNCFCALWINKQKISGFLWWRERKKLGKRWSNVLVSWPFNLVTGFTNFSLHPNKIPFQRLTKCLHIHPSKMSLTKPSDSGWITSREFQFTFLLFRAQLSAKISQKIRHRERSLFFLSGDSLHSTSLIHLWAPHFHMP